MAQRQPKKSDCTDGSLSKLRLSSNLLNVLPLLFSRTCPPTRPTPRKRDSNVRFAFLYIILEMNSTILPKAALPVRQFSPAQVCRRQRFRASTCAGARKPAAARFTASAKPHRRTVASSKQPVVQPVAARVSKAVASINAPL